MKKEFESLNLNEKLLKAVERCGFESPTEIQQRSIPVILNGCDLLASAQTGTGKTAAFVLPILQRLDAHTNKTKRGPRALILTPTRELAQQINEDIHKFNAYTRMTTGSVLGGMSYPPQIKLLQRPLDLLVATPGRLLDHMQSGRIDFSRLEVLVLDEADRMLDMGFIADVRTIVKATPKNRQTLLFSATMDGPVLSISRDILNDPEVIQLAVRRQRHALITQHIHQVDNPEHKHRLLAHHLSSNAVTQALIFTATKRGADRLARMLSGQGHDSAALHGDMTQAARNRTLEKMRKGKLRFLVATDVASRGLDIKDVSHVINYDLPTSPEDYIHRIGRTGRAGVTGNAITLVGPGDWSKLAGIEKLTGEPINRSVIVGLEPSLKEPRYSHANSSRTFKPRGFKRRRTGTRRMKTMSGR